MSIVAADLHNRGFAANKYEARKMIKSCRIGPGQRKPYPSGVRKPRTTQVKLIADKITTDAEGKPLIIPAGSYEPVKMARLPASEKRLERLHRSKARAAEEVEIEALRRELAALEAEHEQG